MIEKQEQDRKTTSVQLEVVTSQPQQPEVWRHLANLQSGAMMMTL